MLGIGFGRARKARGLSQEDLALKSDVDRSYVGGIERGTRNPSVITLCDLAETLDMDLGTLTRDLPVPEPV